MQTGGLPSRQAARFSQDPVVSTLNHADETIEPG